MQEGLIYRDNRLVNWCCRLRTAVSDIEVDYIEIESATQLPVPGYDDKVEFGALISFAYPLEGSEASAEASETSSGGDSDWGRRRRRRRRSRRLRCGHRRHRWRRSRRLSNRRTRCTGKWK